MRTSARSSLAFLAALSLICAPQAPASAAVPPPAGEPVVQVVCHTCNGFRYQNPGERAIYLVIDGERHHVPDELTYFNLWVDFSGVQSGGAVIDIGSPLLSGSYLARERETGRVYLVGRTKRWIPNETILNQYSFARSKIRDVSQGSLPGRGPDIPGR
ncbi:hypothetical protein [Lentzea terrae]|uniref:hypothetical protein n=1 Tax=Lentzea terrae TaxID=2200761 RepID=UPI001300360B|nr:hypothetical protein [Lentzea terrae]